MSVCEGKSIIECLFSGGAGPGNDPTAVTPGSPPSGGISGGLQDHDMDCASDSLLGFITEPFCVAGKSLTEGGLSFANLLSNKLLWLAVIIIVGVVIAARFL